MAKIGSKTGKSNARAQEPRRKYRFSQTGSLVHAQIRKVAESRGFAQMRLLTDWDEVVGPEIARLARPEKVGYARQGMGATLHVSCVPGGATEVQMMTPVIIERVNACYGYRAVTKVRIVQAAARGFAEPKATFIPRKTTPKPKLDPAARAKLNDTIASIEDDGLRAALATLNHNLEHREDR